MCKRLLTLCVMLLTLSSFGQCAFNISGPAAVCKGSVVNLSTDYSGPGTLRWETSHGGSFSSPTGVNVSFYSAQSDTGMVALYASIDDSGAFCNNFVDTFFLQVKDVYLYAGPDQVVCSMTNSVDLQAYSSGFVNWTTTGTGSFTLNGPSNGGTYYFSMEDTANGVVVFFANTTYNGCSKHDSVFVTISDSVQVVDAGPNKSMCSNEYAVKITGSAYGNLNWSSSGSGIFQFQGLDSTRYVPSAADIAVGSVTITLSSNGCGTGSDSMTLSILPSPQVNAGPDQTMAAQNTVTATIVNASGVVWTTSGSGSFIPDDTSISVVYQASAADQFSNGVFITATTRGNGSCNASYDVLSIVRDSTCNLYAGSDQVVCSNDTVDLNATYLAGSVNWSSTGAGTIINENAHDAYYIPAPADNNTTVYFICNSTSGACISSDTMMVTFSNGSATVDVFGDDTTCSSATSHLVYGVTNTSSRYWTTSGSGYFANPYSDSTTYYPSASDKANGAVALTLTAIGCGSVSDSKVLSFIPGPIVEAGDNQTMATTNSLTATITNASGVMWTTSGTGSFSSTTSLSTVYTPSASDIDSGFVMITVATVGNGGCEAAYDQLVLTGNTVACNISITKSQSGNTIDVVASNTDGQSVGSYFWDFGDGGYAYGKVQSHTYADTGTYYVVAYYSTPNGLCDDTASIIVHVTSVVTSTFNISGTIYAATDRIDYAYVTLFELDGLVYKYMQTIELEPADNGNYAFSNVPNGQYIIYAIPTFQSSYINFIPCYFPNVTLWAGATAIIVNNANQSGKNIYMIPFTPPSNGWNLGSAVIQGIITFDGSTALRTTDASANPSQYAVVSLYNSSNELLATTNTDEFGNYSFEGIATGNYTLKVEYPGGKAGATSFPVTATNGNTTQVNTEITREQIVSGVETATSTTVVAAYPNPVQGDLTISISSGNAQVELYNSLGTMVESVVMTSDRANINMSTLPAGIYSYVVKQGDQKFTGKVVKE